MKKITTILLFLATISLFAQSNGRESWSFGLGVSNHTMAGDHRSIGTGLSNGASDNSPLNLGGYLYIDKMFNPAFGLELKGFYTTMSGAAQEITSTYTLNDAGGVYLRNTHFDGNAYGAELTAIINFSNLAARPYRTKTRRWNLAGYIGMGVQNYDSKLYDNATNNVLVDFGDSPSEDGIANSVYYTGGIGLKYKLTKNFDIELRPTVNLNEEDHLDAARSNKQNLEVFYQTHLGLVFKINGKDHDNYVWQSEGIEEKVEAPDFDALVDAAVASKLKDMPKADLDYDKDGFPNNVDPCPFVYSKTNKGCPGDADKDGVPDDRDLCPNTPGDKNNNGCVRPAVAAAPVQTYTPPASTVYQTSNISEQVYFGLNSAALDYKAKSDLNAIAFYMLDHPYAIFMLQGNTDKGGNQAYNQKLSEKRANTVKKYLVNRGVNADNIEIVAHGETIPKFKDLEVNRLNRRVDISLKN